LNIFNRLVVIALMISVIICAAGSILGVSLLQGDVMEGFRQVAAAYPSGVGLETEFVAGTGILAAIFAIVAFIILWFEVIPGGSSAVRLQQVSGSTAAITTEAISQRIRYDAEQIPDVRQARPTVKTNGKDVDVKLELKLAPGVDVPPLVENVSRTVREGVESKMGVKLRRLNISVRHDAYSKKNLPAKVPANSGSPL
jgi:uncharacterized alkaline shock family protein YloU